MRSRIPCPRPLLAGALMLSLLAAAVVTVPSFADGSRRDAHHGSHHKPLVIGHRGASGYRPEHTLASYELAARMGADYVEPDLVITKDGVLVARHENEIGGTTDVSSHPEFTNRKTTKTIDGVELTGWFTEDFTLTELKTLRAKERIPQTRPHNTLYDGRYEVPTFQEVINLVKRLRHQLGRRIGIYPETKHPTYFRDLGLPLERPLVKMLRRNDLDGRKAKVFVQSFEIANLKALDRKIDAPLVQLLGGATARPFDVAKAGGTLTYGDMATPPGLQDVAEYADGIGPSKNYIVPRDASGASLPPTTFVDDAHDAGLKVHPYTFRNENQFLALELRTGTDPNAYGNAFAEYEQFFELGVDGLFSDNPDTAVEARKGL